MTDDQQQRRAELLGLALAGALNEHERRELDVARLRDPSIDVELRELAGIAQAIGESGWDDTQPSASLRARIAAIGEQQSGREPVPEGVERASDLRRGRRRPRFVAVAILAAAACIGIGAGGVLGLQALGHQPKQGPPGTLGVSETITFAGEPAGVEIDAALVAHTWGTETVLKIAGLDADDTYSVVLVGAGGATPSGSFHGSIVTIDCSLNASVMRAAVTEVDIVDASGVTIATAAVPPVA